MSERGARVPNKVVHIVQCTCCGWRGRRKRVFMPCGKCGYWRPRTDIEIVARIREEAQRRYEAAGRAALERGEQDG